MSTQLDKNRTFNLLWFLNKRLAGADLTLFFSLDDIKKHLREIVGDELFSFRQAGCGKASRGSVRTYKESAQTNYIPLFRGDNSN